MTLKESAEMLKYMAATWPQMEVTEGRIAVLYEHFKGYRPSELKGALFQIAKGSRSPHPPAISEIHAALKPRTRPELRVFQKTEAIPQQVRALIDIEIREALENA